MMFFVWTGVAGCLAVIGLAILYAFWPSIRYSHRKAKHLIELTQTETEVAPEYKWATPARSHEPFADDYRDWRTQTFDSLSPESLDSTSNEGVD